MSPEPLSQYEAMKRRHRTHENIRFLSRSFLLVMLGSSQGACQPEDPVCSLLAPQCERHFQIEIRPRSGELLPVGNYAVEITAEQPAMTRSCVIESLSKVSCSGGDPDGGVSVLGNGIDAGRFSHLIVSPGAEAYGNVTIRVERDSEILIEQSFSPTYTTRTERADPRCSLMLTCTAAPTATLRVD